MTLTSGQILQSRYRVNALLAQGGFGAVYQVWDNNLGKRVAIKENLDTSPEATNVRVSNRTWFGPVSRSVYGGFRCAR